MTSGLLEDLPRSSRKRPRPWVARRCLRPGPYPCEPASALLRLPPSLPSPIPTDGTNLIRTESFKALLLVMRGKGMGLSNGWKSTLRRSRRGMARPAKRAIPGLWTGGHLSYGQVSTIPRSIGKKEKTQCQFRIHSCQPLFRGKWDIIYSLLGKRVE